jgi:serine/threonine protein kinase
MIQKSTASMATDLWTFGCILFKMLTGQVPFTGTNSYKVFQKILEKEIDFPDYISINAQDLIDNLIMLDPLDRIGAPGGKNDISILKKHPFFSGINFNEIEKISVMEIVQ